jgi:hypothetical protein
MNSIELMNPVLCRIVWWIGTDVSGTLMPQNLNCVIVTTCSLVHGYRCFGRTVFLRFLSEFLLTKCLNQHDGHSPFMGGKREVQNLPSWSNFKELVAILGRILRPTVRGRWTIYKFSEKTTEPYYIFVNINFFSLWLDSPLGA